ncbi:uncharacterized protein LOC116943022 [Petromyzon marinus]|uniref:uncharacterized protein LOC116943022 n=1 Tax=Petromyzon marinus TaxID=7757 RepID=UPI003F728C4E
MSAASPRSRHGSIRSQGRSCLDIVRSLHPGRGSLRGQSPAPSCSPCSPITPPDVWGTPPSGPSPTPPGAPPHRQGPWGPGVPARGSAAPSPAPSPVPSQGRPAVMSPPLFFHSRSAAPSPGPFHSRSAATSPGPFHSRSAAPSPGPFHSRSAAPSPGPFHSGSAALSPTPMSAPSPRVWIQRRHSIAGGRLSSKLRDERGLSGVVNGAPTGGRRSVTPLQGAATQNGGPTVVPSSGRRGSSANPQLLKYLMQGESVRDGLARGSRADGGGWDGGPPSHAEAPGEEATLPELLQKGFDETLVILKQAELPESRARRFRASLQQAAAAIRDALREASSLQHQRHGADTRQRSEEIAEKMERLLLGLVLVQNEILVTKAYLGPESPSRRAVETNGEHSQISVEPESPSKRNSQRCGSCSRVSAELRAALEREAQRGAVVVAARDAEMTTQLAALDRLRLTNDVARSSAVEAELRAEVSGLRETARRAQAARDAALGASRRAESELEAARAARDAARRAEAERRSARDAEAEAVAARVARLCDRADELDRALSKQAESVMGRFWCETFTVTRREEEENGVDDENEDDAFSQDSRDHLSRLSQLESSLERSHALFSAVLLRLEDTIINSQGECQKAERRKAELQEQLRSTGEQMEQYSEMVLALYTENQHLEKSRCASQATLRGLRAALAELGSGRAQHEQLLQERDEEAARLRRHNEALQLELVASRGSGERAARVCVDDLKQKFERLLAQARDDHASEIEGLKKRLCEYQLEAGRLGELYSGLQEQTGREREQLGESKTLLETLKTQNMELNQKLSPLTRKESITRTITTTKLEARYPILQLLPRYEGDGAPPTRSVQTVVLEREGQRQYKIRSVNSEDAADLDIDLV